MKNGMKKNLMMIHGWGLGNACWSDLGEPLSTQFAVHWHDMPGYGKAAAAELSFDKAVQRLIAEIPDSATLCAWSTGSLLAMQAALSAPQKVDRLILVSSTPSFVQRPQWPHAQARFVLELFRKSLPLLPDKTLQRFTTLFNQGDTQSKEISHKLVARLAEQATPPTTSLLQGLAWLDSVDLRSELTHIAQPTLLIHGQNDPLMPLAAAEAMTKLIPQCQLAVFANAAHAPFLNDPAQFIQLVQTFCTS